MCFIFCLQCVLYLVCSVFYILFAVCFIFCLQRVLYFVYSPLFICLQQILFSLLQIALVCDVHSVDSGVPSGPLYIS